MDDLISRQAAIDALGGNEPVGDPSKMDDDDVVKMWERIRIINIINKLPSAQPVDKDIDAPSTDTISRQDAIRIVDGIDTWQAGWRGNAIESIKALPSEQPERKTGWWIPCSERLPEEGHDVLITKESFKIKGYEQDVIKAKRSVDPRSGKIEWWSPEFGTLTNKAVLAWMPLPEPFKEGES